MSLQAIIETIEGDSGSLSYRLKLFRFSGNRRGGPSAYIQAGLHAGERPGVAAVDALLPLLRKADEEGRMRGDVTIVPHANPIGLSQYHFGELQGRFDLGTRNNFNRGFPRVERPDPSALPQIGLRELTDARLRHRLMQLSLGHQIVLDLHCDDEGVAYVYAPSVLWPAMQDSIAALGIETVVVWNGSSGNSFDEVHVEALSGLSETERATRLVLTIEYRGLRDVDRGLAQADAWGLYRLLVQRGLVDDEGVPPPNRFEGRVGRSDSIETIPAPVGGTVLFDVGPGDRVERGQRVASILFDPGEPEGRVTLAAPQSGFVLTRRRSRAARKGDDLMKILGNQPAGTSRRLPFEE